MRLLLLVLLIANNYFLVAQDTIRGIQFVDQPIEEPVKVWYDAFHPNGCSCGSDASFPGGMAELQRYVEKHFNPPLIPNQSYRYNRIYTRFTVNEDGTLSNIRIERGICEQLDMAAREMLFNMPRWIPAGNSCQSFKTDVRLPIYVLIQ